MKKLNRNGEINVLLIGMIVFALLFVTSTIFAVMYYGKYKDWKNNTQPKIDEAVEKAKSDQETELNKKFEEQEKYPLKEYMSERSLGSIKVMYPKTWGAYVDEGTNNSTPVSGFFHPSFVPSKEKKVKYALRVELIQSDYAQELKKWEDKVKKKEATASNTVISDVTGTRYDGKIDNETTGSVVYMPLRDKTLKIWTESDDYRADFDNIILKNMSFLP